MKGKSTKPRAAPKARATPKSKAINRKTPSPPKKGKRVFVSFDYDNDKNKKNLLVGQSKNKQAPFEISDWSLKEAAPDKKWGSKARDRIKRSDKVIVVLGKQTHRAPGVKKEIKIAHQEKKPVTQITSDPKYRSVPNAGKRRKWNWDNLRKELK